MPKGSSSSIADLVVTGADLGGLLGISARRVRELRDDGVIPDDPNGQYVLGDAVSAYCAHMRPAAGKEAAGGSDAGGSLDAARVRLVSAQADAREMLNSQLRGDAVLSEDLNVIVGGTFDAVRNKLLAVPVSAAARVLGMTSKVDVQAEIAALINDALADLATMEVVSTVKDRARRRAGRGAIIDVAEDEAAQLD